MNSLVFYALVKKWCAQDAMLFELQKKMNSKTKQHICIEF